MAEIRPLFRWEACGNLPLDFHGIQMSGAPIRSPAQTTGDAHHMSVHGKAGNAESVAQHHIGGFAANAWQAGQLIHRLWDLAVKAFVQCRGQADEMLGFRPVEAERMDNILDLSRVGLCQIMSRGIRGEQFGVTVLTRLSVVWALSTVAISS